MKGIKEFDLRDNKAIRLREGYKIVMKKDEQGKNIGICISRNGELEKEFEPDEIIQVPGYCTKTADMPDRAFRNGYHTAKEMDCEEIIDPRTNNEKRKDNKIYPEFKPERVTVNISEMESAIMKLIEEKKIFSVDQKNKKYEIIAFRYNGTIEAIAMDKYSGPENHEEAVDLAFKRDHKKHVYACTTLRTMEKAPYFMHVLNNQ